MVLLSGHAATWELGRGGFQELRQADMAAPVTKASWTSSATETLGRDIGEAIRIATSGRHGPVHLSLPSDLLDARVESSAVVWPNWQALRPAVLPDAMADKILTAIAEAARPVVIAGPQMSTVNGRALFAKLEAANAPRSSGRARAAPPTPRSAPSRSHQARRSDRAARQGPRPHHQVGDGPGSTPLRCFHRSDRRWSSAPEGNGRAAGDRLCR
jgi:hypothetical protein